MAYRPTEKTEAHKRARNQQLLESAIKVVAREGFQALTISAVAEEANVATGTVYKYFESKAALCTEVFRAGSGREVEQVQAAAFPRARKSCMERLRDAITIFAERAIAGHRLAYSLIAEPVDPMVEAERLKYRHAYAGIFSSLIEEGIERKEFAPQDPVASAAAIVGALAETLVGPLGIGAPASGKFDQTQLIDSITTFCLKAVRA
ncbi:MAG: TetR/AcrR family transcriptional regulator [Oleiphilaceae bacterium]|nr:TetR/AcrR family transcriptional regulator [Oleiphilaceae bacterium]